MLPPLVFSPYLRPRIWGGARLRDRLGRKVPDDQPYGESWELSALPEHDSVVADGPLQGATLSQLWATRRAELWGASKPPYGGERFPLLIKWLDCNQLLSVQVHPDDAGAGKLLNEPCGKSEAWIFLEAEPGCQAYFGLHPKTSPEEFGRRMLDGSVEQCLVTISPQPGEVIHVPPGSVHALGPGQLLLEVEQPSDATFRVYDYNRPGPDGQPRELHRDQALESIDWNRSCPPALMNQPWSECPAGVEGSVLVESPSFVIHRVHLTQPLSSLWSSPLEGVMSSWTVMGGGGTVSSAADEVVRTVQLGDTILIPASTKNVVWTPTSPIGLTLIAATVPPAV